MNYKKNVGKYLRTQIVGTSVIEINLHFYIIIISLITVCNNTKFFSWLYFII